MWFVNALADVAGQVMALLMFGAVIVAAFVITDSKARARRAKNRKARALRRAWRAR